MNRPTLTRGQIRFFARCELRGECIPFFVSRANNMAIEDEIDRILRARTRRRYRRKGRANRASV